MDQFSVVAWDFFTLNNGNEIPFALVTNSSQLHPELRVRIDPSIQPDTNIASQILNELDPFTSMSRELSTPNYIHGIASMPIRNNSQLDPEFIQVNHSIQPDTDLTSLSLNESNILNSYLVIANEQAMSEELMFHRPRPIESEPFSDQEVESEEPIEQSDAESEPEFHDTLEYQDEIKREEDNYSDASENDDKTKMEEDNYSNTVETQPAEPNPTNPNPAEYHPVIINILVVLMITWALSKPVLGFMIRGACKAISWTFEAVWKLLKWTWEMLPEELKDKIKALVLFALCAVIALSFLYMICKCK